MEGKNWRWYTGEQRQQSKSEEREARIGEW